MSCFHGYNITPKCVILNSKWNHCTLTCIVGAFGLCLFLECWRKWVPCVGLHSAEGGNVCSLTNAKYIGC